MSYFAVRPVKGLADQGRFGRFAYYCWAVGEIPLLAGILKLGG